MTDRIKFELLCDLTTDIVGLHQGALSDKTRKQIIHIPRMVASVVARMTNDIHPTIIADVLEVNGFKKKKQAVACVLI